MGCWGQIHPLPPEKNYFQKTQVRVKSLYTPDITQPAFTCSKLTIETPSYKVGKMFKVNNKVTRTTASFWCLYC